MRRARWPMIFWVLLAPLVVFQVQLQAGTGYPTTRQAAHYIVFEKIIDGTTTPLYYRLVDMEAPLQSLTSKQMSNVLGQASRNDQQIVVVLQNDSGQPVYQDVIRVSFWLRGEFHGAPQKAPIDGHFISLQTTSFVVRVPQIAGTTLVLKNNHMETFAHFDMQQLATRTPLIEMEPSAAIESLGPTGSAGNRVDFLIMGDGYTSDQAAKFAGDAATVAAQFFSISPYSIYSNYFNIITLFTVSAQSGADHPSYNSSCGYSDPTCCGDPTMQSDPLQGTMVNTAFDSRFCAFWIHRLLVSNTSKVFAAAAAVPDWDTILLIVNDGTYGGSGGSVATISMGSTAAQIAQHEYGHSFINLADEYESAYPGYPTCSDFSGMSPCEANVTDVTNLSQIKWNPWIDPITPIPTPNDPLYDGIVGLFQGARYFSTGMYRSGYNCIMRNLSGPFCQVPSQAFVLKLYNGGWGVPIKGINLIEPGSTSPANPTVKLTHPASQTFHADVLSPVGGPPPQITWMENGVPISGATDNSYTYTTSAAKLGLTQITLRVKDATSLVHPSMVGNALQDTYTWNLNVATTFYLPIIIKNQQGQ